MKPEIGYLPANIIGKVRQIASRFGLFGLAAMLTLAAAFGCHPPAGPPKSSQAYAGAELFRSKCGKCHEPDRALTRFRSAEVWFETILRMKEQHQADISREEIASLVAYHVERQRQEAAIFEENCQRCHPGKVFLDKSLSPEQARAIILRMQERAGNSMAEKDVEIIVRYHAQAQQAALEENLRAVRQDILQEEPMIAKGKRLFVEKCSSCHQLSKALTFMHDPNVWERTIRRMQHYSKGAITNREMEKLVDYHQSRQEEEIEAFRTTCTRCHDDERIRRRSMSEGDWRETILRMQRKAPELISDEKVILIAAYFHRRELTMARIFSDRCRTCHSGSGAGGNSGDARAQMRALSALANAEYGGGINITESELLAVHVERQKREMELFETKCYTCHPDGTLRSARADQERWGPGTRAEWISFIAALKGVDLSPAVQNTIDGQIEYHLLNH